ncbi:MAG: flagellar basal-body rod protein FlgG [Rhodobacteraceae bacterium HLUCCA12]|nr:MAG: flagellar basal-body rod protein FlgG [Rhodobacteraceae bacterium HLUCCA12]
MRALQIAATGMSTQQMRVDTVANNLANMSTSAYDARRAEFADLHYQQLTRAGTISSSDGTVVPTGVQIGLGARPASVAMQPAQGALVQTGGDLDIAIEGRGWLEVTLPDGRPAFSRDGSLKRNGDGLIVTSDGFEVAPGIAIPPEARSVTINPEGEVWGYFDDRVEPEQLGQLTLAGFTNERGLEAMGSNLFLETEASGPAIMGNPGQDGLGALRQGYLEESSVDPVRELTEMIKAQRGYELNAKVITASDQMLAATAQVR